MKSTYFFILTFVCLSILYSSVCTLTYSIDLGSEFMKVAVVVPGIPMEVALNGESQRKTPTVVFIKDGERLFGDPAMNMGIKYPKYLYHSISNLIGKTINDPAVKEFITNFPYYEMLMDANNQLAFKDGELAYTVEELLAMILGHARDIAETYSEVSMKAGIIVLPPFFSQDQRKAVLRSAYIAGINVLRLMNSNTAVALNYGIYRRKSFNSSAQYYMFYDVGSSATVASIIEYKTIKDADEGFGAESPQLSVIGVGFDQTLGASQFTLRVQQYLANAFNFAKMTKTDVTKVARSMAKLYKEAIRVVKVLSANNEVYAQVENVVDDKDFKLKITRIEFEELCKDLLLRFMEPVHKALESAQIPMANIKEVILMGGGTRIPKIQSMLLKTSGRKELGKGINTDEASALGAIYQAAFISPGFKVQKFDVRDINLFPISVDYYKNNTAHSISSTIIFKAIDSLPKKTALTFTSFTKNFDYNISCGIIDSDKEVLFHVSLKNFTDIYNNQMELSEKYMTELKGIKSHFALDHSGLLSLVNIDAIFVRKSINDKEESAFKKIGDSITNLFGSLTDEKNEDDLMKNIVSDKNETENLINLTAVNDSVVQKTNNFKPIIIRENIYFLQTWKSFIIASNTSLEGSKQMILSLKAIDDDKLSLEKAKNELESYIFSVKSRLQDDDVYIKCSSDSERNSVIEEAERLSEWYDDQDMSTVKGEYSAKYKSLVELMKNIDVRVQEVQSRPAAIEKLNIMLNTSQVFLNNMNNVTGEGKILTVTEYESLSRLIKETTTWLENTKKNFSSMKLYENSVVTVDDFESHIRNLEREVNYLINKISLWKIEASKISAANAEKMKKEIPKTKTELPDIKLNTKIEVADVPLDTKSESSPREDASEIKRNETMQTAEDALPFDTLASMSGNDEHIDL